MRLLIAIALVLGMATLACPVLCAGATDPAAVWSTYHWDAVRGGQNANSSDIINPGTIKAIWAFPRTDPGANTPDQAKMIVDDSDSRGYFNVKGNWITKSPDSAAYNNAYVQALAISAASQSTPAVAAWSFPVELPPGKYQVFVWVPSGKQVTDAAVYTVNDDYGAHSFVFDQATAIGAWQAISNSYFTFKGAKPNEDVELSSKVDASALSNNYVIADAVKFVPAMTQEIYASPVTANINVDLLDPDDPSKGLVWDHTKDPINEATCVYVGTVEAPSAGASSADTGAFYCICGVTPTVSNPTNADGTPNTAIPDSARLVKISKYLGKPIWRYPKNGTDPNDRLNYIGNRLPIEGPIAGGVYSSATLAMVPDADPTKPDKLACFVTGDDRQVYAFDAQTGDLLWKGPGITVGEESDSNVVGTSTNWKPSGLRPDAFGGQFHYVACSATPADTCTWTFLSNDQVNARPGGAEGLSYSIFAWIPYPGGTGDLVRSAHATYTINYTDSSGKAVSTDVRINQNGANSAGTWVKLGQSYFNPTSVVLKNTALSGIPNPIDKTKTLTEADQAVIADAVMIVPDTINGLGYPTPVTDWVPDKSAAKYVYVATETGRVMSFDAKARDNHVGHLNWIYPAVRTKQQPKPSETDQTAFGHIGASPAYSGANGNLYVATMGGIVHCLTPNGADTPPTEVMDTTGKKPFFQIDTPAGEVASDFLSSPCIDEQLKQIYIPSTGGSMYCLDKTDGHIVWQYPDPSTNDNPLGAFRYSTPAVATAGNTRRVWCASTDGHIYSFMAAADISGGSRRLFIDDTGAQHGPVAYDEPSFGNPVQGSVALDGEGTPSHKDIFMYVGDMGDKKGTLHWRDAASGAVPNDPTNPYDPNNPSATSPNEGWTAPDILFSSPSVSNLVVDTTPVSYIFVGCADGHMIAFSRAGGAWGGEWNGGEWPFAGNWRDQNAEKTSSAPDTNVQFDVFNDQFWRDSLNLNPEPDPTTPNFTSNWPDKANGINNAVISLDMKVPGSNDAYSNSSNDDLTRDNYLTSEAKKQRTSANLASSRLGATKSNTVFYEWGEHIYGIVWNLPEQKWLEGANFADKIKPRLTNQSCGESSGATSSGPNGNVDGLVVNVRIIKDYTCLKPVVDGTTNKTTYQALTDTSGDPVRRSYAMIDIYIDGTKDRPPGPGPGWTLYVDLDKRTSSTTSGTTTTTGPTIHESIPLAKLKLNGSGFDIVTIAATKNSVPQVREAQLGINNPIAIQDDNPTSTEGNGWIAWSQAPNRGDPDAHLNGNNRYSDNTDTSTQAAQPYNFTRLPSPFINLYEVMHGTSSREAALGVADRSAMGVPRPIDGFPNGRTVPRFRIEDRDLTWRGDEPYIECQAKDANGNPIANVKYGIKFPWDFGIGSIDYPNIYTRYQNYQLVSTDKNPATTATDMLPVYMITGHTDPATYEQSLIQPDHVLVSVDVPRFQPANEGDTNAPGYYRGMIAYVDSNNDSSFESGNTSHGRPVSWQEPYRTFRVGLNVPPDPKIEVEEQTVDIGRAPHGLGQYLNLTAGKPFGPFNDAFTAYNTNPLIQQWFKPITIRNAGNVNLYNIRLDQALWLDGDQALYGSQNGTSQVLPGTHITSSLDVIPPPGVFSPFGNSPFSYTSTFNNAAGNNVFLGYTLSKPRVGDPDPTTMTIPDKRAWDNWYLGGDASTQSALGMAGWPTDKPLPVLVSVQVPLTQPVGNYQSIDRAHGVPYVAVFSDLGGLTQDYLSDGSPDHLQPHLGDPVAAPSFELKLAVRENQLTGGITPTTLPQIDAPDPSTGNFLICGDSTPAAFRDPNDLSVHLFWSSNRMESTPPPDDPRFASAPWFINHALLGYGNSNWLNALPDHWWAMPGSYLPPSQWTIPPNGNPPPGLIQYSSGAGGSATKNTAASASGGALSAATYSVRHFSPSIGENLAVPATATKNRRFLVWAGTADFADPTTKKLSQQSAIFYTDVTSDPQRAAGTPPNIYAIEHDSSMAKRSPAAVPDGNSMWMFWQGGNAGNWSIYYTTSNGGADGYDTTKIQWQPDTKLRTADCLSSVGSPNPILRHLWADIRGHNETNFTDPFIGPYNGGGVTKMFDVVYAGTTKLTNNSDIMLTRYADQTGGGSSPGRMPLPLPRVLNETLARDAKLGFYTSQHLAWIRLPSGTPQPPDNWGGWTPDPSYPRTPTLNPPYVRVYFPDAYTDGAVSLPAGAVISATDGSVTGTGSLDTPATAITPDVDSVSGIYTYSYTSGSLADKVLGKMIIDYSSGILRFQNRFKETAIAVGTGANASTRFSAPEVHADYTPQTWRLTTDPSVDGSPRAFIERTSMTDPNDKAKPDEGRVTPGLDPGWQSTKPAPVDRLWVFWRRTTTGAGVEQGTIFYKTMRMGVDLSRLGLPPIPMDPVQGTILSTAFDSGTPIVANSLGPWEIDHTGTKVYFSEVDENYQSMPASLGGRPTSIHIHYLDANKHAHDFDTDLSWITELPEQSLGPWMDSNVNEGSIYAFADPQPQESGTSTNVRSSKIWVFWTSTRGGNSDLFWETLSPNFWGR